ncbi:MAG: DUF3990 domain-containing protein [Treponema sp.]|nr:DUF3990 domain-containing protein [Treponema sp.]
MTLFHGSLYEIKSPQYLAGNPNNDYGTGFYCTENIELAKEWGCADKKDGFANEYIFDDSGLTILNLTDSEFTILHWLCILLQNRTFDIHSEIGITAKQYLLKNFSVDYSEYDVIRGYRADDSYFSFANAFLNNTISVQKLNNAMYLGKLGEQIVLKSLRSFEHLNFVQSHISDNRIYYPKKTERDQNARQDFISIKSGSTITNKDELYVLDLIRNEVKADDKSLQQALFR